MNENMLRRQIIKYIHSAEATDGIVRIELAAGAIALLDMYIDIFPNEQKTYNWLYDWADKLTKHIKANYYLKAWAPRSLGIN